MSVIVLVTAFAGALLLRSAQSHLSDSVVSSVTTALTTLLFNGLISSAR